MFTLGASVIFCAHSYTKFYTAVSRLTDIVVYWCLVVKSCTKRQEVNAYMLNMCVGYSESNAFCLQIICIKISQNCTIALLIAWLFFHTVFIFVTTLHSTVSSCCPHTTTVDAQHSSVSCHLCNGVFQRIKQMKVWWCEVRTVGCKWQHLPSRYFVVVSVMCTCVWPCSVLGKQHLRHFPGAANSVQISIRSS